MAEFVGGAALGAAFGVAFAVLHDTVKNVGSKVLMFQSVLKSLKSNLDLLAPVVGEISRLNIELGLPEEETKSLIEDMNKAVRLIITCSAIPWWNRISKAHHSKQLTELDKAIVKFCQVHMPAQIKRDTLQILKNTSQISHILEDKSSHILGNTSQISQILGDMSSQILEDTSHISQILQILEEIKAFREENKLKVKDMSQTLQMVLEENKAFREENKLKEKAQILITPSGQCGKTTTLEIHGQDVLIKGCNLTIAEHDIKNEVRQQSAPEVLSENNALDHGSKHDANGFCQIGIRFETDNPFKRQSLRSSKKVKKCGVRLLFKKDIEDPIPTDSNSDSDLTLVTEGNKVKRSRDEYDGAGPSGEGSSNDVPHPKRMERPTEFGNSDSEESSEYKDCDEELSDVQ